MRKDRIGTILSNQQVAQDTYEMLLQFQDWETMQGGQFIHIQLPNKEKLMRRPFCICDFDNENKTILVCYAVVGDGTKELAQLKVGENLNCMFPLGNGWTIKDEYKKIMLIGGGIGSAVLPAVITAYPDKEYYVMLGFGNSKKIVLDKRLEKKAKKVLISTDDGSCGYHGFCTTLAKEQAQIIKPDAIFCCGPEIMFKSIGREFKDMDIPIYVSLEERMGCGIGACLVCNCKVMTSQGQKYVRVCKDGPVFELKEIVL